MTDRELLELAAKASGMWEDSFLLDEDDMPDYYKDKGYRLAWGKGWWNPLTDDSDALWLAVKLGICFGPNFEGDRAVCFANDVHNITEAFGTDPYAATRRAIVRAAAEIGKAIP